MRDLGFEKSKAIAHDRITDSERIAIVEPISNPERRTANREHIPDPQRVPQPERIPNPASQIPTRYKEVARVLIRVFALNLAVALAKIIFGYSSGAISVLSDGFHSLTDGASNVVGLVGVYAARQPPDADHPYGHRKYETVAASVVTLFLLLVVIEVLRNAVDNLTGRTSAHEITFGSFAVMLVTVVINLFVVMYESREGNRLGSEVLLVDATQTRGDVWSSLTVIGALVGAHALSHVVKDRLMARYPQIADAIIHIEPPPNIS